ncbi:MAG: response regulator [Lachnospiraceae bacterium]|nr:response regulator [Candidatus Colinaster equi]
MYRVMLIDDEPSIRNLLKATINWEEVGMEVVGEAGSGIEAINIIDDINPDIAFVDIFMPFMNGIEFAEFASRRYPKLTMIIMTAFDEFEYARKCIGLPVFDYLLKPVVRNEVMQTLSRLKTKLDETKPVFVEEVMEAESNSMDQVRKYLQEHYMDSTLNLTSVAQEFGFSASYLSRKFKQEIGKGFLEYLNECRMERAIKMAQANVKMFQTSVAVGIPDPNYFGRCFKKYTGMSYSDYIGKK